MNEVDGYRLHRQEQHYTLKRTRVYGDLWYQDIFRVYAEFLDAPASTTTWCRCPSTRNHADFLNLFADVLTVRLDDHPIYVASAGRSCSRLAAADLAAGLGQHAADLRGRHRLLPRQVGRGCLLGAARHLNPTALRLGGPRPEFLRPVDDLPAQERATPSTCITCTSTTQRPVAPATASRRAQRQHVRRPLRRRHEQPLPLRFRGHVPVRRLGQPGISPAPTRRVGLPLRDVPHGPAVLGRLRLRLRRPHTAARRATDLQPVIPVRPLLLRLSRPGGPAEHRGPERPVRGLPDHVDARGGAVSSFSAGQRQDALYNSAATAIRRDPTGKAGNTLATKSTCTPTSTSPHQDILIGYSHLFAGSYIRNAPGVGKKPPAGALLRPVQLQVVTAGLPTLDAHEPQRQQRIKIPCCAAGSCSGPTPRSSRSGAMLSRPLPPGPVKLSAMGRESMPPPACHPRDALLDPTPRSNTNHFIRVGCHAFAAPSCRTSKAIGDGPRKHATPGMPPPTRPLLSC